MELNLTKTIAAGVWILAVFAVGFGIGVTSLPGWIALIGLALLPPIVISLFWKDDRTMSERIYEARR